MLYSHLIRTESVFAKICLVFTLAIAALAAGIMYREGNLASRMELQRHLSQEVLRFHVLANSDSAEDQSLKLEVRDAVLDYLEAEMPDVQEVEESEKWVRLHIDEIEETARETVRENDAEQTVSAAVTTCWFPDRTYGDVTFPAGNYKALRIELGEARGHNWWCVLYPDLCFMDTTNAVLPDEGKKKLKNVLTEEEYSGITAGSDFKISWFFRKEQIE